MMDRNIEVEIRGPLSKDDYKRIKSFFDKNASFVESKNRVLIDYSTLNEEGSIDNRTKDVRLRATNGIPEIIIKLGNWGEGEARREISLKTAKGTFDDLVEVFGHLGWKRGMLCIRNSFVYTYKEVEFALVEVPGHSYYFEAEKMIGQESEKGKALEEIGRVCSQLNLKQFNKEEFFEYIDLLNGSVNEVFDFEVAPKGYFKQRFSI